MGDHPAHDASGGVPTIEDSTAEHSLLPTNVEHPNSDFRTRVRVVGQAHHFDPQLFVGRESELSRMHDFLKSNDESRGQRLLVLSGMKGIGKTQLANAYVHHYGEDYEAVFWTDAESRVALDRSIQVINRQLSTSRASSEGQDQGGTNIHKWLCSPKNKRWLLIFDNHDPSQFNISKHFPTASHGTVIVTTTSQLSCATGLEICIGPFADFEDSLNMLKRWSQRHSLLEDPQIESVLHHLQGLPLALAIAGSCLRAVPLTAQEYRQEYDACWKTNWVGNSGLPTSQIHALHTAWDVSYNHLKRRAPDAADLLKLLAYFDGRNISSELLYTDESAVPGLRHVLNQKEVLESTMNILREYRFADIQPLTQSWTMNSCIHDWTFGKLNQHVDGQLYTYALDRVGHLIELADWSLLDRPSYAHLAAHALWLQQDCFWTLEGLDEILLDRLGEAYNIAYLLASQDQPQAAERVYKRILRWMERILGESDTLTLQTFENLARLYVAQGNLDMAEQLYERALNGYEGSTYFDDMSVLSRCNNLGLFYMNRGKLADAEGMFRRALDGKESLLGLDDESTLSTMYNLGLLYWRRGKLDEAMKMYEQTLAGLEKLFESKHRSLLDTVNNLGLLYRVAGQMHKAEQMHIRSLHGHEESFGHDDESTFRAVNNLGYLYIAQGKLDKASELFCRVHSSHHDSATAAGWQATIKQFLPLLSNGPQESGDWLQAMQEQILSLIRHANTWGKGHARIMSWLFKALVRTKDDQNAQQAFLYYCMYRSDVLISIYNMSCDGCGSAFTAETGCSACRHCCDIFLCQQCVAKYVVGDVKLSTCSGHDYFHVGAPVFDKLGSKKPAESVQLSEVDTWLRDLEAHYRDLDWLVV